MIEIQITDEKVYNRLKKYAIYSSDLTRVCSFRDELANLLIENDLEVNVDENSTEKIIPTLTIQGRNIMKLQNASSEMLYFVGCRSEYDPTISVKNMNEVAKLVENNLVETDEKFNNIYSKMGYRSKINELVCANVKFYGKGKLTDYIDGDLTITSAKLPDHNEKPIVYKQMEVTITDPIEKKDKYDEFIGKDKYGSKIILRFYVRNPILKSIAFKGNKINIASTKIIVEDNNDHIIYDPIILPKGLTYVKDIIYSPKNRKIPVDLWRNLYYEFMFRYNLGK